MKIRTTKEKIQSAILLTERIVGKKESLPVLSCILLDATKDGLFIRATNLEAGIEVQVPADIEEIGTVAVNAHVLSQTIRSITNEKVTLTIEDLNLLIESRGTKTLIKAVVHNEFPILSSKKENKGIIVSRIHFIQGLQSVFYAASPSMIRPELGSVYVSIQPQSILCVATDSFRLAERIITNVTSKDSHDLLIPLKHAGELIHVLEHILNETIELIIDDSQMTILGDGVRYISRVVDAVFPNYKEIIPKKFTTEATILKSDFTEILRKARVFSGTDQHIGMHLYPSRKIFSATASNASVGEMSDSIDAALTGEDLDINFHIGYLSDCLSSITSDSITLGFSGVGRAVVVRSVSDTNFTYLVMPLNR